MMTRLISRASLRPPAQQRFHESFIHFHRESINRQSPWVSQIKTKETPHAPLKEITPRPCTAQRDHLFSSWPSWVSPLALLLSPINTPRPAKHTISSRATSSRRGTTTSQIVPARDHFRITFPIVAQFYSASHLPCPGVPDILPPGLLLFWGCTLL
jgi:hypothetical protein